jgi:hypothetical protein
LKDDAISSQTKDIKATITNETKVGGGSNRNSVIDEGRVFNSVAIITRGPEFHHRGDEGEVVCGGRILFVFRISEVDRLSTAEVAELQVQSFLVGGVYRPVLISVFWVFPAPAFALPLESNHLKPFACKPSDEEER